MERHEASAVLSALSESMVKRRDSNVPGYVLVLGAGASVSSGYPTWADLAHEYCEQRSIAVPCGTDPIDAFKAALRGKAPSGADIYTAFADKLSGGVPSAGYRHLANLVSQGFFSHILSTNFDCLLEQALMRLMPPDRVKVLVRGEQDDKGIAWHLTSGMPRTVLVKLHGDLASNWFITQDEATYAFGDSLRSALSALLSRRGCIIVGHQMRDLDLLSAILTAGSGPLYYVNPSPPRADSAMADILKPRDAERHAVSGREGNFDTFFRTLDVEVQRRICTSHSMRNRRLELESRIAEGIEKGSSYTGAAKLDQMAAKFALDINHRHRPDVIAFIDDPSAPAGPDLRKRIEDRLRERKGIHICTIRIEGEKDTRTHNRQVRSCKVDLEVPASDKARSMLVLDGISFSGRTLELALASMKEWFPGDMVRPGVLIIHEQLRQSIGRDPSHPLKDTIWGDVTDRHEVFFPWGVTQATGECRHVLKGLGEEEYLVRVIKRPWGTIEALVEEKQCSVRILTIEADKPLSFQRHLCRDELFISLDDNIGLEICGRDLEGVTEVPAFSDIRETRSLILEKGDYLLIPRGIWHRFRASKDRARLLEIAYGLYDQKGDIERIDDIFGRELLDGDE